jgi:sulfur-oxidizing protein SoxA
MEDRLNLALRYGLPFIFAGLAFAAIVAARAETKSPAVKPASPDNPLIELVPGRRYLSPKLAAQQADEFDNPAIPLVLNAERIWKQPDGESGKSCNSCHAKGTGPVPLDRPAATYPKYDAQAGKVISLEQRINHCRSTHMQATPWSDGSPEMIGMTALLKYQSRGSPYKVDVTGPAAPAFEAGKALFDARIGRLRLSCAQCHNERYGQVFSGETLSQGHPLDFPAYDVSEGRVVSLHERFRMCNVLAKEDPKPLGNDDYIALELYLAWRSQNLLIEAPGVRP